MDSEEKEISDAFDKGELQLQDPDPELLSLLRKAGENTFRKDKRINIRLSSHDLENQIPTTGCTECAERASVRHDLRLRSPPLGALVALLHCFKLRSTFILVFFQTNFLWNFSSSSSSINRKNLFNMVIITLLLSSLSFIVINLR
jgi:hypothetical protein